MRPEGVGSDPIEKDGTMRERFTMGLGGFLALILVSGARGEEPPLTEYFRAETAAIEARPLAGIVMGSLEDWEAHRPEMQRRMWEMLGLRPTPSRTPLEARVTATTERPDFVVENVLFQSSPGLYVTGNLYRPRVVAGPLPAILYVCGHARVEKDGVIYGCKAHYQHHAAWYAANGYVCLVVDTLQLGELPGLHHGTNKLGMWWWQSRGYTPAGIEAWNGIRAIDYLISRPEVDPKKIGVTGRSGGGATSWWLGAIDDRIAAVAAVAGITDLRDHVVDGVVEGHCDCMYMVNTYRWDFPLVAALVAPKPLLIENTDRDPIFPEDGVRRVFEQLEVIYAWYGASDKLGLVIGRGGHVDSAEIRHPSFAFFEKWLKGKDATIAEPDRKVPIESLKVLKPGEIPPDNRNDAIHESFVARSEAPPVPGSAEAWRVLRTRWLAEVKAKVFRGWPWDEDARAPDTMMAADESKEGVRLRAFDFRSQTGVRLRVWLLTSGEGAPKSLTLRVLGQGEGALLDDGLKSLREELEPGRALAVLAPRGVGPTSWPAKKDTHIRRRFALLGQTLDGMRVWDVRRSLAALRTVSDLDGVPVGLVGVGQAAPLALWGAVFEPEIASIELIDPPATVRDGPALLNLDRILGMPQALALLYPRPVTLRSTPPAAWRWASDLGLGLSGGGETWPRFAP